jgi:hypothetical protein
MKRNFGGYRFKEDSEVETSGTRWLITLNKMVFSLLKRNFGGYRFKEDSEVETTGTRWLITLDMD